MADRKLKDKGARRSDRRECVKCGFDHSYNTTNGEPFNVRFDRLADLLVYTCPTCGYQFREPCRDAEG